MALAHLDVTLENLGHVAKLVRSQSLPVVIGASDGDVVMMVSSLSEQLSGPIGVWIEISEDFSAPLAARDVATLSWLVELDHVVISAPSLVSSHADVVRALLTNDEVNFSNDVATLRGAYNRPAPPRPLVVWCYDGATLRHDDVVLVERSRVIIDAGVWTTFAEGSAIGGHFD